jgi:uncharacterized protein (DUF433 family)
MTIGHFERNFQVPCPSCTGLANLSVGQLGLREAVESQFNEFSSCFATRPVQLDSRTVTVSEIMPLGNGFSIKDREILGGVPVFGGTREPSRLCLEGGESLEEFLAVLPSVSREMATAALEEARELLSAGV